MVDGRGTDGLYLAKIDALGISGEGCSEAEVVALEQAVGLSLPPAFRAYLRRCGKVPDEVFVGSDCRYGHLLHLREYAGRLLQENDRPFKLPKEAFVFLMHQGYQFLYFLADGKSPDPAVHHYLEGEEGPEQMSDSFTAYLAAAKAGGAGPSVGDPEA